MTWPDMSGPRVEFTISITLEPGADTKEINFARDAGCHAVLAFAEEIHRRLKGFDHVVESKWRIGTLEEQQKAKEQERQFQTIVDALHVRYDKIKDGLGPIIDFCEAERERVTGDTTSAVAAILLRVARNLRAVRGDNTLDIINDSVEEALKRSGLA